MVSEQALCSVMPSFPALLPKKRKNEKEKAKLATKEVPLIPSFIFAVVVY